MGDILVLIQYFLNVSGDNCFVIIVVVVMGCTGSVFVQGTVCRERQVRISGVHYFMLTFGTSATCVLFCGVPHMTRVWMKTSCACMIVSNVVSMCPSIISIVELFVWTWWSLAQQSVGSRLL